MGAPEVGDDPDRWAPPVGERERDERVRWAGGLSWAGEISWVAAEKEKTEELGRGEEKEGEGLEWALGHMGMGFGVWVCFFLFFFFKSFLNNFSKLF
jgi:hypothetical protein